MRIIDIRALDDEELNVRCPAVFSGVRPKGRTISASYQSGRKHHGLLYVYCGSVEFFDCPLGSLKAGGGLLIYIPKEYRYKMRYTEDGTTFVLVNFDLFDGNENEVALFPDISIITDDRSEKRLTGIMSEFEVSAAAGNLGASLRRKELTYRLLRMVLGGEPLRASEKKYLSILSGELLLKQSYLENLPISELAEASRVSVSTFRALFTEKYGISPIQYRNRLRIRRASDILKEGSCTVAEAAYASGFDNIGYFCRYYKRITGETPTETKKKAIE